MQLETESGKLARSINPTRRSPIVADYRWVGMHGIGRFASEVLKRVNATPLKTRLKLLHPLDPFVQARNAEASGCSSFFSPGYYAPAGLKMPFSFVIHDLIHLRYRPETSLSKSIFYNALVKPAARRAGAVFTVSNFSKIEIQEWANLPAERITVVGNGVSRCFTSTGPRFSHTAPYILYVGALRAHKNIDRMLRAFALSKEAKSHHLLLTGRADKEVHAKAVTLGIADRVSFLNHPPDEDLAAAYRGATSVLLPSLYEGFGIPAVEAMASGTPVIASSGGALEEVTGGAALLCDPKDEESISHAINRSITDSALRNVITALGIDRASTFTWDAVASKIDRCISGFTP